MTAKTKPPILPVPDRARIARLCKLALSSGAVIVDTETDGVKADAAITDIAVLGANDVLGWERLLRTPEREGPEFPALYAELNDLLKGRTVFVYSLFHQRMFENHLKRNELTPIAVGEWIDVLPLWAEYNGDWDRDAGRWRMLKLPRLGLRALGDAESVRALVRVMAAWTPETVVNAEPESV